MPKALVTYAAIGIPSLLIVTGHHKSLPFAYTIRSWWMLRTIIDRAKRNNMQPQPIFGILSQNYTCLWDDIDYNQHMNNSTYNKYLDFARICLMYNVLTKAMLVPEYNILCHNAGVMTLLKREIPPFRNFTVQSRLWTWNQKWIWIQHRFVTEATKPGSNEKKNVVACMAISKLVFKKPSGITVPPHQVLELCGHDLSDPAIEERRQRNWQLAEMILKADDLFKNNAIDWEMPHVSRPKL